MNPESAPQLSPEYHEQAPVSSEQLANTGERLNEQSREREQNMQQVDRQNGAPLPPPVSAPFPQAPVPLPAVQQVADDTVGPTVANDDDLIEKEWVDKAKKIIADTQNDPYRREQEVNKLQIDYLRKRYGKELGSSD